ncbi:Thermophilic serine proteinase precursor [compost metagenome]
MKTQASLAILMTLAVTAAGCGVGPSATTATVKASDVQALAKSGEIIVKFRSGQSRQAITGLTQRLGLRTVGAIAKLDMQVVKGGTAETLAALKASPEVLFAEVNATESLPPVRKETGVIKSGDPMMDQQWSLSKINAAGAWAVTKGDAKTVVAVVDTGVDYNHPDLAGRVIKGYDFANKDEDPMDGQGHGTHCAGIVAAGLDNGVGVAGVAPGVSILAVKVLSDAGSGSTDDVCAGIVYAADHGASVISLSLGGSGGQQAKQAAVDYALSKGAVVVAAMGNNGKEMQVYPGGSKGVIGVGATTAEDTRATFSNFGDWISVGAPGHKILSSVPGGGYQAFSGTSMATPAVAGLAALIRSQYPTLSAKEVQARIEGSAVDLGTPGFDKEFGHGRIDAAAAVKAARR